MVKRLSIITAVLLCIMLVLSGCDSNTVSGIILSDKPYTAREDFNTVNSPAELTKESDAYASVYLIESPKGMEYTIKWVMDGAEVKTETKTLTTNQQGAIVFSLESGKLKEGTLQMQILYKGELLAEKEITVV